MRRLGRYWKPVMVSLVFLLGCAAFLQSGMITGDPAHRMLKALYYALSLFILGGLDIGLPGAPSTAATIVLWFLYFLAPLLTAGFVYDFIQNKLLGRIPRRLKGHTILCGLGRNGHLIYELIRETLPKGHKVVVIEKNETNPYLAAVRKDPWAWLIQNDFSRLPVLASARLQKARRVIFSTNLDLDNLNALMELKSHGPAVPGQTIHCHLGDLEMLDNLQQTLFREEAYRGVHVFNGYQCATRQLYQMLKTDAFLGEQGTVFIFFGYGRFAHMLFSHISGEVRAGAADEVIIVTQRMAPEFDLQRLLPRSSQAEQARPCTIHPPLFLDMHQPDTWARIDQLLEGNTRPVLAFLCRDNDVANLDLAISIKLKGPVSLRKATIICRMYAETVSDLSEMLDHRLTLNQSRDVLLFPLQAELKRAFARDIFAQGHEGTLSTART